MNQLTESESPNIPETKGPTEPQNTRLDTLSESPGAACWFLRSAPADSDVDGDTSRERATLAGAHAQPAPAGPAGEEKHAKMLSAGGSAQNKDIQSHLLITAVHNWFMSLLFVE